jgi:hypothetical protein
MDLELKQLGQTLAVGAFAMLGFWLIIRMLKGDLLKNILPSEERLKQINLVFNGVLLAFVFAVGIVLENFSKHIVAEREPPMKVFRILLGYNLRKDKETRFDVLFKYENNKYLPNEFCNRLENECYFNLVPEYVIRSFLNKEKDTCKFNINSINPTGDFLISTNYLNNIAKDKVFEEDNYYTELTTISSRMDFLRAFIFLITLLVYLNFIAILSSSFKKNQERCQSFKVFLARCKENEISILSGILLLSILITSSSDSIMLVKCVLSLCSIFVLARICYSFKYLTELDKIKDDDKSDEQKIVKQIEQNFNSLLLFTVFCLLLSFILPTAYEAECSNYNRRVLGYHLNILKKEQKDNGPKNKEFTILKIDIDSLKKKLL